MTEDIYPSFYLKPYLPFTIFVYHFMIQNMYICIMYDLYHFMFDLCTMDMDEDGLCIHIASRYKSLLIQLYLIFENKKDWYRWVW